MEIPPKIVVDKKVGLGKPVIEGSHVPVDLILEKLAGGMSYEEIISEYGIYKEDILAVLGYARKISAWGINNQKMEERPASKTKFVTVVLVLLAGIVGFTGVEKFHGSINNLSVGGVMLLIPLTLFWLKFRQYD